MTTINYYKSKDGIFVYGLESDKINGVLGSETFLHGWKFFETGDPVKLEKFKPAKKRVVGFALKNKDLKSDKIPEYLDKKIVKEDFDNDYNKIWTNPDYSDFQSLYEEVIETEESFFEDEEFECNLKGEIDVENPNSIKDMKISLYINGQYPSEGKKEFKISSLAQYSELEKMLTPDFALYNRPCSIDSKTTYDIIRTHVNDNIDARYAVVTSNYDFCFTVKKKLKIKPYTNTWEVKKSNGKSYARPKFNSKIIDSKQVEIFEMTHEKKGYQNYTIIKGFKGDNLKDLIENINLYLDELMHVINKPLKECPSCNGCGNILEERFDQNKR